MKIINEEIDEVNQKIAALRAKVNDEKAKFNQQAERRDLLERAWRNDKSLQEIHVEVLQLMMSESIKIVENMELDTKYQKAEIRLKIRDAQINKLQEQIVYRDELIDEARRALKSAGLEANTLHDERILNVQEIIYDHKTIFDNGGLTSHRANDSRIGNYPRGAGNASPRRDNYASN